MQNVVSSHCRPDQRSDLSDFLNSYFKFRSSLQSRSPSGPLSWAWLGQGSFSSQDVGKCHTRTELNQPVGYSILYTSGLLCENGSWSRWFFVVLWQSGCLGAGLSDGIFYFIVFIFIYSFFAGVIALFHHSLYCSIKLSLSQRIEFCILFHISSSSPTGEGRKRVGEDSCKITHVVFSFNLA